VLGVPWSVGVRAASIVCVSRTSRTQYLTASSIDGFIADPDNSLDWLFEVEQGEDGKERWQAFLGDVGAMAMGATTYEWCLAHDDFLHAPEKWHDYYADRPCWVFTHRDLPAVPGVDLRFVSGDVAPAHTDMVAAAGGRNVWLVGGGELVGLFHDAGLLDEVRVNLAPVTLAAGAPVLPRRIEGLRLRDVHRNGQLVDLTYDVPRAAR
jgi:dihydrofolate reductase